MKKQKIKIEPLKVKSSIVSASKSKRNKNPNGGYTWVGIHGTV